MIDALTIAAAALVLIGSFTALLSKKTFDKLIALGILTAGAVMFFVGNGYVDVAIAASLLMPVGTIFLLLLLRKKKEEQK
ncbi:MAG: DUF2108 domain-containing protein [Methanocorpusculum sp.]|nr:DUF2108 domain-containing protein [Methanocorpusculum sp.]